MKHIAINHVVLTAGWPEAMVIAAVLILSIWSLRHAPPRSELILGATVLFLLALMLLPHPFWMGLVSKHVLAMMRSVFPSSSPWKLEQVIHFGAFLLLGFVVWTFGRDLRGWKAIVVAGGLAVAIELLQAWTPDRTPRFRDIRINVIGAGSGLLVGMLFVAVVRARLRRGNPQDAARATHVWDPRQWVIDVLRGNADCVMPSGAADQDAALRVAHTEGVVSLVHTALLRPIMATRVPAVLLEQFAGESRACSARNLLAVAECRRISGALAKAGVPAIWLKGMALAQWLYPQPNLRDSSDIDLLVSSHADALRVAQVVAPLGYSLPNRYVAGDLVVHELLAYSEHLKLELDLHWDISNRAIYANRLRWAQLSEAAIDLPGLGTHARGLGPVQAMLHALIHRSLNQLTGQGMRLRWLYDLHLLAQRLSPHAWHELVELATDRGLASACRSGLEATASTFRTDVPAGVMHTLVDRSASERVRSERLGNWTYLQWSTLRTLPDWKTRARWLRQLLLPNMDHLRVRYGGDGASSLRIIARRLHDGVRRWLRY